MHSASVPFGRKSADSFWMGMSSSPCKGRFKNVNRGSRSEVTKA